MKPSFVPYLTLNDYLLQIRSGQLNNQILDYISEGGLFERQEAESFAIDEVRSIIGSQYYIDFEFRDTLPFNWNRKYYAGDRCIIDFPLWVGSAPVLNNIQSEEGGTISNGINSYNIGDCVIYNSGLNYSNGQYQGNFQDGSVWIGYRCLTPNNDSSFDFSKWIKIGNQYDIYYIDFPYEIFQLIPQKQIGIKTTGLYTANNSKVCWDKKLYLCINDTIIGTHQYKEQFYSINQIPAPNIFPNQPMLPNKINSYFPNFQYSDLGNLSSFSSGNQQWCDKGEFYFKSIDPFYTNWNDPDLNCGKFAWNEDWIKQWSCGDNRSSTMKQIVIAIAIYELIGRNSFMLKERSIRRDWAYRKLEKILKGDNTTLIPIIQPDQDNDISYGGSPKIINTF